MIDETKYQKIDQGAVRCMRLNCAIFTGIVLLIEAAVIAIVGIAAIPVWLWICFGGLTAVLLGYTVISPQVRYARYRYAIDEEAIRVREGFLWISYSVVPVERLHKIELSQGPVARLFGFFTVNVTTAGGEVRIKFIKEAVATEIAEHLKDVINRIAAEERAARA